MTCTIITRRAEKNDDACREQDLSEMIFCSHVISPHVRDNESALVAIDKMIRYASF